MVDGPIARKEMMRKDEEEEKEGCSSCFALLAGWLTAGEQGIDMGHR